MLMVNIYLYCLYSVDIRQITEFSSETHDAVTSMVAMAPGTVAMVQQVNYCTSVTQGTTSYGN